MGLDGCLDGRGAPFVDAPGELVPQGATAVMLCATATALADAGLGLPEEARQRVLRTDVAEFVALLNARPDRNEAWREWQRKHSGWWPDAPPEVVCPDIGYPYHYSLVVRYPDGRSVPLLVGCRGITSGTRTREGSMREVVDEFLRRYESQ